jgi:hypothetical protein
VAGDVTVTRVQVVRVVWLAMAVVTGTSRAASVEGVVLDYQGTPLQGVVAELEDASATPLHVDASLPNHPISHSLTNDLGQFRLPCPRAGLFKIWVRAPHHRAEAIPLLVSRDDQHVSVKIHLVPESPPRMIESAEIHFLGERPLPMTRDESGAWIFDRSDDEGPLLYKLKLSTEIGAIHMPNPSEGAYEPALFTIARSASSGAG